ncbi:MAG TPA: DUF4832 domain-containing protein, partial [Gemmatales bacterium]|nr:DUF4832 domain-containing protein [Gemmatales bacterium]
MLGRIIFAGFLLAGLGWMTAVGQVPSTTFRLEPAPSPVDNPMKGLVPYSRPAKDRFPHSLEFNYISYGDLVTGYDTFNWKPLENLLNDISSRGNQAIFRIFIEYPGKKNIIPAFLVQDGLKVHRYVNTNTQPLPPAEIETPDYEDPRLRKSFQNFIAALGKKYDGDPRIGYITAGLLGTWGEWHTYPRNDLWASRAVQTEVMDAYEAAFQKTRVLFRYPRGENNDERDAPNAHRPFGYHDDSFAWATLHTGKRNEEWFYMTALQQAGATEKWKTQPIGGEIRPEAWGKVFDAKPGDKHIQNFDDCVQATHVTWLMDSGMFEKKASPERWKRAIESVRKMGYDFHVPEATLKQSGPGQLTMSWITRNQGVAPWYHPWPLEVALYTGGKLQQEQKLEATLQGILPGEERTQEATWANVPPGRYQVLVRVPNPLLQGKPIRFANASQDEHVPGWLTLGPV